MRDVTREDRALGLFCPYRDEGRCVGGRCVAWTVSWENDSEGFCAALRPAYEQEIGQGWKKHGRRIRSVQKKLLARVKQAEAERDAALAELARLREVERLAKEYLAKALEYREAKQRHEGEGALGWFVAAAREAKRAAGEALFAALDKETIANG